MKQTAVEYLLNELRIDDLAKGEHLSVVLDICEKAKEMEKEQIIDAYQNGVNILIYSKEKMDKKSEQYYNETYNK